MVNHTSYSSRLMHLKQRLNSLTDEDRSDDYHSTVEFFIDIVPQLMGAERCTIFVVEMESQRMCSLFGTGLSGQQIDLPSTGSIAGQVIASGNAIIDNELLSKHGTHSMVDLKTGFLTKSIVCVPIKKTSGQGITGAIEVLNKKGRESFDTGDMLLLEKVASFLSKAVENILIRKELLRLSKQLSSAVEDYEELQVSGSQFIAESPPIRGVLELVNSISKVPINVYIEGENGTGKELIARMIHKKSTYSDGPFVAVNCAAIPENLVESEFFGHEKGAFTGADRRRKGRFEEAKGGTLMLDEIADMPISMQSKFLRALQEGEGSRLGSNELIRYDFRLISASNRSLKKEVEAGNFREDLFFRLFSLEVTVPPLRERKEDIIPLALMFLEEIMKRFNKDVAGFSSRVLNIFSRYAWPGNIRQMRREVERLVALTSNGEYINAAACSPELQNQLPLIPTETEFSEYALPDQVKALEKNLIIQALRKSNGNQRKAAKLLHITRQGLYNKIKRYGVDVNVSN